MPKSFSIWLDEETGIALSGLAKYEDRKRGALIKVLIRREYCQLKKEIVASKEFNNKDYE
jgi:hypothetical protein